MNEIFALIMEIGEKRNVLPIKDKIWSFQVDDRWSFKVNGYTTTQDGIPAFRVMVEYNGFPAGLIGYDGGVIAAGDAANEDAFIKALKAQIGEAS